MDPKIVDAINEAVTTLIKPFEGFRSNAYQDVTGIWTVGYGATGSDIKEGTVWDTARAYSDLYARVRILADAVTSYITVKVNKNQLAALISFTYNVGIGSFKRSTLLRLLNQEEYKAAAYQLLLWNKADGKVISGLSRRRTAEMTLFLTP